ncbi:class I adenylate-forming enzyme family protein [Hydrogenophaga sp. BPS33]|uniref:class I adenylate-forming enzyme family protein n=1 Tax=Hydrogenophaga sp. BPS33 TaxID=2651974 RepID=UPI00131F67B5|nr:AMP-binding protein [Hydrogenophaga sp. BPS33]QHE86960.1 long-chain fatty acid--CoA ligase [Hydrogenophaga sp. BPS33]
MNVARLLTRSARTFPEQDAVLVGTRVWCNYRELARRAGALGRGLTERMGLQPGDRVALLLHNCPQYLEILYGAWAAGLVVVPINHKLHAREVEYILSDSGAQALFTSVDLGADLRLDARLAAIDVGTTDYSALLTGEVLSPLQRAPDDIAWLFYTSGTTGRPKGVMQTHRNLLSMGLCYFADVDPVQRGDASLYAAPMSHGAGLYNLPHVMAAARHVIPESGGFDPDEILSLASRLRDVSLFAAPTMVKRLVERAMARGLDGDGIKTIVYGGGPMYAADIEQAIAVMGPRFVQIYGQGECPMAITALSRDHLMNRTHPRHAQRMGSVGVAQSSVEIRVAQPDGTPLPFGEIGEILVRGDPVMSGYWGNLEATGQTLRDGWLHTGDIGELDADGFLSLKDRSKDMIISGGSNIYPREVEEVLLRHPCVREVAVIGRPHGEWGEEVVAYVVPRPGQALDTDELDALCLAHIARFKRPRQYRLIDELPKNSYGKVLKTALRELTLNDRRQPT